MSLNVTAPAVRFASAAQLLASLDNRCIGAPEQRTALPLPSYPSRSMMVALAMPPPSHIVCRP